MRTNQLEPRCRRQPPVKSFKAGRSFLRAICQCTASQRRTRSQHKSDGGLLRLSWKERPSGDIPEDLILFSGDARLEKSKWEDVCSQESSNLSIVRPLSFLRLSPLGFSPTTRVPI